MKVLNEEIRDLREEAGLREKFKKYTMADCGDGVYRRYYPDADVEDFENWVKELKAQIPDGRYEENTVCDNRFFGIEQENGYLYLTYYPCRKALCLYLAGEGGLIPHQLASGVNIADVPAVTQFTPTDPFEEPNGNNGNFGMCYLFDLGKGHFLIYDGLANRQNDDERIFAALKAATPEGEKPVIDAWIFTHSHFDHVAGAHKLAQKYSAELTVRNFIMNMPDSSRYSLATSRECIECYVKWLPEIFACFPEAKIWKVHAGQRFFVGDAEIEVLYTQEDCFEDKLANINDSSVVTRVYYAGSSFFFPADIETKKASELLHDMYGPYLKSDYYQVAHHGWNSCALAYYDDVDPQNILFPVRKRHWYKDCFWEFPATERLGREYKETKKKFYVSIEEDIVIRFS